MNQDGSKVNQYNSSNYKKKDLKKEIFTRNMFHASILLQAGASFKCFKKHKKFIYMYLDTSFLDKRSLANQFESLAHDLLERKSLKDILENSILSQIEHSYYRARNKLNDEIEKDRKGQRYDDSNDDYDDSYDDYDDSAD